MAILSCFFMGIPPSMSRQDLFRSFEHASNKVLHTPPSLGRGHGPIANQGRVLGRKFAGLFQYAHINRMQHRKMTKNGISVVSIRSERAVPRFLILTRTDW